MKIKISKKLYKLAKIFGHENPLFVVGGYVRNKVAKVYDSDVDLACNLKIEDVEKLLAGSRYKFCVKNKALGTAIISCGKEEYEYSTFRNEFYKGEGEHTPEVINFDASIVEDVKRRDFTVNALYYNILDGEIEDFYGGLNDIKTKHIRTVEDPEYVMQNDGVRILRMIRLACELNYFVDDATFAAACKYKDNLNNISQDRLRTEFLKIINATYRFGKWAKRNRSFSPNLAFNGIKMLDKMDAWQYFVKKNRDIIGNLQGVGSYLTTFICSKKQDLLLTFCYDAYHYLNKYKQVLTVNEFCSSFLGKSGLNFKKQDYEYIQNAITNINKAMSLDYNQKDIVKTFAITKLQHTTCSEVRILKTLSLVRYKQIIDCLKQAKSKQYPVVISKVKLKVEKFYKSNPTFDKAKTKELLTKLQQAIILDKVKNNHAALMTYCKETLLKGGETK